MEEKITQRELRNNSGEIMRGLDRGTEYVVTRNGVSVGTLIPIRNNEFVDSDVLLAAFDGTESVDFENFRSDIEEIVDPYV